MTEQDIDKACDALKAITARAHSQDEMDTRELAAANGAINLLGEAFKDLKRIADAAEVTAMYVSTRK
jgi:hypothetical protein